MENFHDSDRACLHSTTSVNRGNDCHSSKKFRRLAWENKAGFLYCIKYTW